VQFLGSPPPGTSNSNGAATDAAGPLYGIAGDEEEKLDLTDQEAIAFAAAAG
jgi:hypothetical protein